MQNPAELEQHFRHQVSGNAGLMSPLCMNGCRREDTIQNASQAKRQSGLIGTGFNPLAQAPKGLSDDLFRVILPYPFLHRRRKRQRLVRFKTEGTNEAEGRLRHVGGLYLEGGVAHARIEPGETHGAIIDSKIDERALVEGHAQRDVPRRLGKDQLISFTSNRSYLEDVGWEIK